MDRGTGRPGGGREGCVNENPAGERWGGSGLRGVTFTSSFASRGVVARARRRQPRVTRSRVIVRKLIPQDQSARSDRRWLARGEGGAGGRGSVLRGGNNFREEQRTWPCVLLATARARNDQSRLRIVESTVWQREALRSITSGQRGRIEKEVESRAVVASPLRARRRSISGPARDRFPRRRSSSIGPS